MKPKPSEPHQLGTLQEAFLREWEAENRDLPESTAKVLKMLRDWQQFLNTKGYRPLMEARP